MPFAGHCLHAATYQLQFCRASRNAFCCCRNNKVITPTDSCTFSVLSGSIYIDNLQYIQGRLIHPLTDSCTFSVLSGYLMYITMATTISHAYI